MPKVVERKFVISGADLKRQWEEAKANRTRLSACITHYFGPLDTVVRKYRCACCEGEADAAYLLAYCEGFAAAGKDPTEVVPNYKRGFA